MTCPAVSRKTGNLSRSAADGPVARRPSGSKDVPSQPERRTTFSSPGSARVPGMHGAEVTLVSNRALGQELDPAGFSACVASAVMSLRPSIPIVKADEAAVASADEVEMLSLKVANRAGSKGYFRARIEGHSRHSVYTSRPQEDQWQNDKSGRRKQRGR